MKPKKSTQTTHALLQRGKGYRCACSISGACFPRSFEAIVCDPHEALYDSLPKEKQRWIRRRAVRGVGEGGMLWGHRLHSGFPQLTHVPDPSRPSFAAEERVIWKELCVQWTMTEILCLGWRNGASTKQRTEWKDEMSGEVTSFRSRQSSVFLKECVCVLKHVCAQV